MREEIKIMLYAIALNCAVALLLGFTFQVFRFLILARINRRHIPYIQTYSIFFISGNTTNYKQIISAPNALLLRPPHTHTHLSTT